MRVLLSEYDLQTTTVSCTRIVGTQTNEEFTAWLESQRLLMKAAVAKKRKIVSILELSAAAPLTAQQRRIQTDWTESNAPLVCLALIGIAFVAPSVVLRGVMTAVFWIKPPPVTHQVCASLDDALHWAFDICEVTGERVQHYVRVEIRRQFMLPVSDDSVAHRT